MQNNTPDEELKAKYNGSDVDMNDLRGLFEQHTAGKMSDKDLRKAAKKIGIKKSFGDSLKDLFKQKRLKEKGIDQSNGAQNTSNFQETLVEVMAQVRKTHFVADGDLYVRIIDHCILLRQEGAGYDPAEYIPQVIKKFQLPAVANPMSHDMNEKELSEEVTKSVEENKSKEDGAE